MEILLEVPSGVISNAVINGIFKTSFTLNGKFQEK